VENYIDESGWSEGHKENVSYAYLDWCTWNGFLYTPKKYRRTKKLPYVPHEKDIEQLIGGFANSIYAPFLQLLKETGFRPVEACRIKPGDFDLEGRKVTLNQPAKGSNPRQMRISLKLVGMLLPLISDTLTGERIWRSKPDHIYNTIRIRRSKLAKSLGNPALLRVNLKSFRHWKATMEYHRTRDILYVKELLGHK